MNTAQVPTVEQIRDANRRAEAGEHTPGPWEVVRDAKGYPLSIRAVGPVTQRAIVKYRSFPWHAGSNAEADAVFIAASPEVFDALLAAVAFVELYTGNGTREQPPAWAVDPSGEFDAEVIAKRARAAIGKARGRQ